MSIEEIRKRHADDKFYSGTPLGAYRQAHIDRGVLLKQVERLTKQRDAWSSACRCIYDAVQEGGTRGRPMELIHKGDWGRVIATIGKAEMLCEPTEERRENG